MTARQILSTATEWMFRTASVRAARASVVSLGTRRERALDQARLLLEVANRVKFPVERLPKGRRPGVLVGLYRDAITCALAAQYPGDDPPPQDLRALWADCAPGELARAAGGPAALDAASRVLFDAPPSSSLDTSAQDAAAAGALAKGLVGDLDAPRNRLDRLIAQRWLRVLLVVAVLLALGAGVRRLLRGPDLTSNVTVRVSSTWNGCANDPPCMALLFHTDPEPNPWAELDLGAPKTIQRIEITNRKDCCSDRAVPLIVESSTDRANWTPVGQRDTEFQTWTLTFKPRLARYVKLRVPRNTAFHLKDVAIR
jgi:hypothetical protein